MPAITAMTKQNQQLNHLQNLPPLKGQRQGPISDPIFLNKGGKASNGLSQQPEQTNLHGQSDDFGNGNKGMVHLMNPQYNNNGGQNDVEFESGAEDAQN